MDNSRLSVVYRPPSPTASEPTSVESSRNPIIGTHNNLKFVFPFNFPPTLEASSVRIITNLNFYKVYYTIFVWSILVITLIPKRKVSLLLLMGMTTLTMLYLIFVGGFPKSTLHQIVDKRLVFFFLFIGTMLAMVLTKAAVHFFVTLAGATPVILVHALLSARYSLFASEKSCADDGLVPIVYFVPFVHEKIGDYEPPTSV